MNKSFAFKLGMVVRFAFWFSAWALIIYGMVMRYSDHMIFGLLLLIALRMK